MQHLVMMRDRRAFRECNVRWPYWRRIRMSLNMQLVHLSRQTQLTFVHHHKLAFPSVIHLLVSCINILILKAVCLLNEPLSWVASFKESTQVFGVKTKAKHTTLSPMIYVVRLKYCSKFEFECLMYFVVWGVDSNCWKWAEKGWYKIAKPL